MESRKSTDGPYFLGSKGDTDILDTVGEGEGGMMWENSIETYPLPYAK